MASATPAGRMKLEWRANPHAAHCSMTSAGHLGVPVHAHAGQGRAGPHDGGPHPGPFQLHLEGADVALEPPLGGHVGGHGRAGPLGHVGGDEDDVAAPAGRHGRGQGAHQSVGAAHVDGQHAVEGLGGRCRARRRRCSGRRWTPGSRPRRGRPRPPWRTGRPSRRRPGRGGWPRPRRPSARMAAAVSSHSSTRRAPSTTGWPSAASAMAVAWPMPEEAPVTTAGRRSGLGSKRGISAGSPWWGGRPGPGR